MTSQPDRHDTMLHPENPLRAFDSLATEGRPFYAYRMPDEDSITLGVGHSVDADSYDGLRSGFLIAPFAPEATPVVIEPAIELQTPMTMPLCLPSISLPDSDSGMPEKYRDSIASLSADLAHRSGKTVISRLIKAEGKIESEAAVFHALCMKYPHSYVYCWRLSPDDDIWMGAVPELLLEVKGSTVRSMALAGTQPHGSSEPWDEKNRMEQKLVTDFISDMFMRERLHPASVGPKDLMAGPVKHLCTMLTAEIADMQGFDCIAFARHLAPTPAVCGLPREDALADIRRIEPHDRRYYGGYSGPVTNRRSCRFYVTLRCMAINPDGTELSLYAGGGITPLSKPDAEWEETRLKARTLLSLFPHDEKQ